MTSLMGRKDLFFYLLTLAILIGGAIFWATDLTSDPPTVFAGKSQSLSTDPAQYVFHARNCVLFGDWDPFDYPRWTVYQHSLTSMVAYLWFSLVDVSLAKANAVGLFLSLGGLVLILLGLLRQHSSWILAAVAFCFVINVALLTHGRLSYLEDGLIFIASLCFLVYCRWGDRIWGVVATGGLIALATFTGKLFGALLLPVLIASVLVAGGHRRWTNAIASVVGFLVTGLVLVWLLYGSDWNAAFAYVGEQSYGLRGFPGGLSSPWSFFEYLIAYGFKNQLFYLDLDILFFIVVGSCLLLLVRGTGRSWRHSRTVSFPLFWMLVGILGLMPLNYSPIRYTLLFVPGVIVFCFTTFDYFLKQKKLTLSIPGKGRTALLILLAWLCLFPVMTNIFYLQTSSSPIRLLTWITLPVAIVLTLLVRHLLFRRRRAIGRGFLLIVTVSVLCLSAVTNVFQFRNLHFRQQNFGILEANADMARILGPDAVVSGPYGSALTIDTHLRSFIHLFGVASVDTTLFDRYPITHLAVDVSNTSEAIAAYPAIGRLQPTATYWIRGIEVKLYNISKVFNNPQARTYRETHYEKSIRHFLDEQWEAAEEEMGLFLESGPDCRSAGLLVGDLLWKRKRFDDVIVHMTTMARHFPTDYLIQFQCGRFLQIIGITRDDRNLLILSDYCYNLAATINPLKSQQIIETREETRRMMSHQPRSDAP